MDSTPARMRTFSGRLVSLVPPYDPSMFVITDIAHHLANVNRFCGAAKRPYSVAQHSVHVAENAGSWNGHEFIRRPEARLGLLHDASEAYLTDVNGNYKKVPHMAGYRADEEALQVALLTAFGMAETGEVTPEVEAAVKHADAVLLQTEGRDLLNGWQAEDGDPAPMRVHIEPWSWRTAEERFLHTFRILFPGY